MNFLVSLASPVASAAGGVISRVQLPMAGAVAFPARQAAGRLLPVASPAPGRAYAGARQHRAQHRAQCRAACLAKANF